MKTGKQCAHTHASFLSCVLYARMRVLTLFFVRAAYLSSRHVHQPPTVSNNNNIISKQQLVIITFIITGHRMVAVNPHINNNDGIIIGLFLFLSPPKTTLFLFPIGVIFLESLVSGYFYFFEPSQQPLWKTKQYDIGINLLG